MTDIALFHVRTFRDGEAGYTAPRPRGHMEVWHDSKRYLYDVRGLHIGGREARRFIESAWGARPSGRFPSYTVE